jgi:hypothetical protein
MFQDKSVLNFEEFFDIYVHIHQEQPLEMFLKEWKDSSKTNVVEVVEGVKQKPKITAMHDFIAGTFAGIILTLVKFKRFIIILLNFFKGWSSI